MPSWSDKSLIISCHYVRDDDRFFAINLKVFRKLIKTLTHTHDIGTLTEIHRPSRRRPLCVLTFDDGLIDHYTQVFPILSELGVTGYFYPSTAPLLKPIVLDTHAIHLLLAEIGEANFAKALNFYYRKLNIKVDLFDYSRKARFNRWASPLLSNIKFSLNSLNNKQRRDILLKLLEDYIGDEKMLSRAFYMQPTQLVELINNSMHVGCHGHNHRALAEISPDDEISEVKQSMRVLDELGFKVNSIAYPFGSFDSSVRSLVASQGISYGLSVEEECLSINSKPLALPRYDVYSIARSLNLV